MYEAPEAKFISLTGNVDSDGANSAMDNLFMVGWLERKGIYLVPELHNSISCKVPCLSVLLHHSEVFSQLRSHLATLTEKCVLSSLNTSSSEVQRIQGYLLSPEYLSYLLSFHPETRQPRQLKKMTCSS